MSRSETIQSSETLYPLASRKILPPKANPHQYILRWSPQSMSAVFLGVGVDVSTAESQLHELGFSVQIPIFLSHALLHEAVNSPALALAAPGIVSISQVIDTPKRSSHSLVKAEMSRPASAQESPEVVSWRIILDVLYFESVRATSGFQAAAVVRALNQDLNRLIPILFWMDKQEKNRKLGRSSSLVEQVAMETRATVDSVVVKLKSLGQPWQFFKA